MAGKKKIVYYTEEFQAYVDADQDKPFEQQEAMAYLVDIFLQLWYKPTEPLQDFRSWFTKRISKYNITPQQLEHVCDNFYDYWSNPEVRDIKNFKSTFFNNFHLRPFLKRGYEGPVNVNSL